MEVGFIGNNKSQDQIMWVCGNGQVEGKITGRYIKEIQSLVIIRIKYLYTEITKN